jgi:hypothetical protein
MEPLGIQKACTTKVLRIRARTRAHSIVSRVSLHHGLTGMHIASRSAPPAFHGKAGAGHDFFMLQTDTGLFPVIPGVYIFFKMKPYSVSRKETRQ